MLIPQSGIGQRSETVRRANLSAILRELHAHGPLSRSELVARTGLTRSAIRGLIGELAAVGLVAEERAPSLGTPGRPSPVVRPNPERVVVLALDIAVDSIAAAVVGLGGEVIHEERVDRGPAMSAADATIAALAALGRSVVAHAPDGAEVIGIGVAVAAVVDRPDGVVAVGPNLGWRDVPLGTMLAHALDVDAPVVVANDADAGALAELRRGAALGLDDIVYLSGEVGVGGGIIVGGQPLTGVAGHAGEVGHLPVNPDGRPCHCGSVGCWETEVGGGALLRLAGRPEHGGRAEIDAVLAAAAAGDARALGALDEIGRWLGVGLAGLVNLLNPRLIVLGGLLGRIHPYVAPRMESELDRRAMRASRGLMHVIPTRLGEDAPLLGAAELAFEPLLADPAVHLGPRDAAADLRSA